MSNTSLSFQEFVSIARQINVNNCQQVPDSFLERLYIDIMDITETDGIILTHNNIAEYLRGRQIASPDMLIAKFNLSFVITAQQDKLEQVLEQLYQLEDVYVHLYDKDLNLIVYVVIE